LDGLAQAGEAIAEALTAGFDAASRDYILRLSVYSICIYALA
jgi:hypothetical protein